MRRRASRRRGSGRRAARRRGIGLAFAAAWRVLRFVPEPVAHAAFAVIADRVWRGGGPAVTQLEANLRRILPALRAGEAHRLARRALRHYLRYYCDLFRLPAWSRRRLLRRTRAHGAEHLAEQLAAGRGTIVALGHCGSWDQAGAWGAATLAPVVSVAEVLEPRAVFEDFLRFRERLGLRIHPLDPRDPPFPKLVAAQSGPEPVVTALLFDRDLTRRGIPVVLAGHAARMAAGPAALAVTTGSSLHFAGLSYARRTTRRVGLARLLPPRREWVLDVDLSEEIPVPAGVGDAEAIRLLTQALADRLAAHLQRHPDSWHMLQKVFTADVERTD